MVLSQISLPPAASKDRYFLRLRFWPALYTPFQSKAFISLLYSYLSGLSSQPQISFTLLNSSLVHPAVGWTSTLGYLQEVQSQPNQYQAIFLKNLLSCLPYTLSWLTHCCLFTVVQKYQGNLALISKSYWLYPLSDAHMHLPTSLIQDYIIAHQITQTEELMFWPYSILLPFGCQHCLPKTEIWSHHSPVLNSSVTLDSACHRALILIYWFLCFRLL